MEIKQEKEEIVVVNKNGVRTSMPDLSMAKYYATDLWKGQVERIEVKTIYVVGE